MKSRMRMITVLCLSLIIFTYDFLKAEEGKVDSNSYNIIRFGLYVQSNLNYSSFKEMNKSLWAMDYPGKFNGLFSSFGFGILTHYSVINDTISSYLSWYRNHIIEDINFNTDYFNYNYNSYYPQNLGKYHPSDFSLFKISRLNNSNLKLSLRLNYLNFKFFKMNNSLDFGIGYKFNWNNLELIKISGNNNDLYDLREIDNNNYTKLNFYNKNESFCLSLGCNLYSDTSDYSKLKSISRIISFMSIIADYYIKTSTDPYIYEKAIPVDYINDSREIFSITVRIGFEYFSKSKADENQGF